MEKIGIVGSGNMGRTLGIRLAKTGHEVFFGARNAEQAKNAVLMAGGDSRSGSTDEAVRFANIIVWTMRETNPSKVLTDVDLLVGKVIIDLNNRDFASDVRSGEWFLESIAEKLQENAPLAQVVKAFNTIAMETFDTNPSDLRSAGAQTFLAGKNAEAKHAVARIAESLGFAAVDMGSDPAAFRAVEALGDVIRLLMTEKHGGASAHLVLRSLPKPNLGTIGERAQSNYK